MTQVLLGLSLLLNAFVLAGFVFHGWFEPPHMFAGGRPPPPPPGQPARWPNPLEALAQELKIDPEQRKAVQPIVDEYEVARRERWRDIGKIRREMSAELQKSSLDWTKVDALVDQMSVLRVEQQKQNLRAIEEMAGKLKPEQRAELHKILGERFGGQPPRPPGRSPGEPPRPPRPPQ